MLYSGYNFCVNYLQTVLSTKKIMKTKLFFYTLFIALAGNNGLKAMDRDDVLHGPHLPIPTPGTLVELREKVQENPNYLSQNPLHLLDLLIQNEAHPKPVTLSRSEIESRNAEHNSERYDAFKALGEGITCGILSYTLMYCALKRTDGLRSFGCFALGIYLVEPTVRNVLYGCQKIAYPTHPRPPQ